LKIKISRHYLYIFLISFFLLLFVFVFSFTVLIPEGQDYREARLELRKENLALRKYQDFYDTTLKTLKDLQGKNRHIITAFDTTFNPKRFEKENKKYFISLHVDKVDFSEIKDVFAIYEINTTSKIDSPTSFYDFLDAINKSDWIIGVDFPINFKREGELIKSYFTMKVYCNNKDINSTASESEAK